MIVEIALPVSAFAGTMANMRNWLDANRCTPVRFETSSTELRAVLIRIEFKTVAEVEAFRRNFGGAQPEVPVAAA